MQNLKFLGIIVVVLFLANSFFGSKSGQTVDLGKVLDRVDYALKNYQSHLESKKVTKVGEKEFKELTTYVAQTLNSDPRFFDKDFGLVVKGDASFIGFIDENSNKLKDDNEDKIFTIEIDEENKRLIATDGAGNSSGLGFSGSGFFTGMLIGSLLSRQRGAGISRGSFNNRKVTPRSSYRAPRSSRSGGLRGGK